MDELTKDAQVLAALESFSVKLVKEIADSAKKYHGGMAVGGSQDTGVIGSTDFNVYYKGGVFIMEFYMANYWYWMEYGRGRSKSGKSKKPFEQTLAGRLYKSKWWISKGIDSVSWYKKYNKVKDETKAKKKITRDLADRALAKKIAMNIHKRGWTKYPKGSQFLTKVLTNQRLELLASDISEIMGEKITLIIESSLTKS